MMAHLLCFSVLCTLLGFIVQEKVTRIVEITPKVVVSQIDSVVAEIRNVNSYLLEEMEKYTIAYSSNTNELYFDRAQKTHTLSQSTIFWIDSLQQLPQQP